MTFLLCSIQLSFVPPRSLLVYEKDVCTVHEIDPPVLLSPLPSLYLSLCQFFPPPCIGLMFINEAFLRKRVSLLSRLCSFFLRLDFLWAGGQEYNLLPFHDISD